MASPSSASLTKLSDFIGTRRSAILKAWKKAVDADPQQTTSTSLTRAQFADHIPEILDAFEYQLSVFKGEGIAVDPGQNAKTLEAKHGLTRWHQGYRFQEVIQEWGHIQVCLLAELNHFGELHPDFDRTVLAGAVRQLVAMVNKAITENAAQYEHMQQAEAASHINDLVGALKSVVEIERCRSALIHQAVHDLGNDISAVRMTAKLLGKKEITEADRMEFTGILEQGVKSVSNMLNELMELARLEAGQEQREICEFDASELLT